jgi:hypothetical protein
MCYSLLRTVNDVAIDLSVCASTVTIQAFGLADKIAAKVHK